MTGRSSPRRIPRLSPALFDENVRAPDVCSAFRGLAGPAPPWRAGGGVCGWGLCLYLGQFGACGVEVVFGSLGPSALGVPRLGEVTGLVLQELAEFVPLAGGVGAEPV